MTKAYLTTNTLLQSTLLVKSKTTIKGDFGIAVLQMHEVFIRKRVNERSKRCYRVYRVFHNWRPIFGHWFMA